MEGYTSSFRDTIRLSFAETEEGTSDYGLSSMQNWKILHYLVPKENCDSVEDIMTYEPSQKNECTGTIVTEGYIEANMDLSVYAGKDDGVIVVTTQINPATSEPNPKIILGKFYKNL